MTARDVGLLISLFLNGLVDRMHFDDGDLIRSRQLIPETCVRIFWALSYRRDDPAGQPSFEIESEDEEI